MKIRNGFVSNSSSSSFCILGVVINEDELKILLKKYNCSNHYEFECKVQDSFENFKCHTGLDNYSCYDLVVGHGIDKLSENKTIKFSKKSIAEELTKILGKEVTVDNVRFHYDGGYDG